MKERHDFQSRSPREVFAHHGSAGSRRDVDAYVSDFGPASILITPHRIYKGRKGIREWITKFWKQLDDGRFEALYVKRSGNVIFVRYNCLARRYRIDDGVATFVVYKGYFSVLTNHYTLTRRSNNIKKGTS